MEKIIGYDIPQKHTYIDVFNEIIDEAKAKNIYENILQNDTTAIIARHELQKLERKIAYLRDLKRKEAIQSQMDSIKPAKRLELN